MSLLVWLIRKSSTELKIVLITLLILVTLPIFAVIVLASSGLSAASRALVSINPATHLVEVFDAGGNKVHELELSTVWPTTGYVSDEFGTRDTLRRLLGLGAHTGIDIANERRQSGTPVTTFMIGSVLLADDTDNSACGISVIIDHGHGITSQYCHLESTATSSSTLVEPGDVIGYMGSTGVSTGPHLHFMTSVYGIPVNPRTFMVGQPRGTY